MKVVFLEEVEGSAHVGEVKVVKNGFARNFLLPRGLAVPATKPNLQRAEKLAHTETLRQEKLDSGARVVAARIAGHTLTITAHVGEQGRLFGSVTAMDIASRLSELAGEDVDHRQVLLGQAIRTTGRQEVRVRLTRNVFATITVDVQATGAEPEVGIEEAVAAAEAADAAAAEREPAS